MLLDIYSTEGALHLTPDSPFDLWHLIFDLYTHHLTWGRGRPWTWHSNVTWPSSGTRVLDIFLGWMDGRLAAVTTQHQIRERIHKQKKISSQNFNFIKLYLQCRLLTVIQSDMIEYFAVTWENLRNMWYMYVRQNISNPKKYLLG